MKLYCIHTCVVKGGKVIEKGQTHDTGDLPKKEDREAYELIASGRMVETNDKEAIATAETEIAAEEKTKAEKKAAAKKDKTEK